MSRQSAYDRWVTVSGRVADEIENTACTGPGDSRLLEVIGAASAAMAELHDEIARLERDRAKVPHPSQDFPWQPQWYPLPERARRYEERPGPLRGYRGVTAHLDPVSSGRPENPRGADRDYPEVYQLACTAALRGGVAEEALNLLDELDRHPGNRVIVLQRARELRTRLDNLGT